MWVPSLENYPCALRGLQRGLLHVYPSELGLKPSSLIANHEGGPHDCSSWRGGRRLGLAICGSQSLRSCGVFPGALVWKASVGPVFEQLISFSQKFCSWLHLQTRHPKPLNQLTPFPKTGPSVGSLCGVQGGGRIQPGVRGASKTCGACRSPTNLTGHLTMQSPNR